MAAVRVSQPRFAITLQIVICHLVALSRRYLLNRSQSEWLEPPEQRCVSVCKSSLLSRVIAAATSATVAQVAISMPLCWQCKRSVLDAESSRLGFEAPSLLV